MNFPSYAEDSQIFKGKNGGIHYNATFVCSTFIICECIGMHQLHTKERTFFVEKTEKCHTYI